MTNSGNENQAGQPQHRRQPQRPLPQTGSVPPPGQASRPTTDIASGRQAGGQSNRPAAVRQAKKRSTVDPASFPQSTYQQPTSPTAFQQSPTSQRAGRSRLSPIQNRPAPAHPTSAPARVRVPGADTTGGNYSERAVHTVGPATMVLEPSSSFQRFTGNNGGWLVWFPLIILGIALPGLFVGLAALTVMDGVNSPIIIFKAMMLMAVIFWLPLSLWYGNLYLISTKMFVSVHQGGLFVRQARAVFFNITESVVPYGQIAAIHFGHVDDSVNRATKHLMRKSTHESIVELSASNLTIVGVTGKKILLPGFSEMFTKQSVANFKRSLQQFMRR